jgi:hypothetical protein
MDLIASAHEGSRMNLENHDRQVYRNKGFLIAGENFGAYEYNP